MKKILFLLVLLLVIVSNVNAQEQANACFFYGEGCPHCAKVEPFIEEFKIKNPNITIDTYEVYKDRENLLLMNSYYEKYKVPQHQRGVPVVFVGDTFLIGDYEILNKLDLTINESLCPQVEKTKADVGTLSILTIIGAALVDSINPCAIAVLLILMSALLVAGDKKRALKAGFAFTISIYISYFLFGLGLFSAIQISGLSYWFYKIVGFIAILIGLFNIKDYFWYAGGGFVMEIPRKWRPTLKKLLGSVTSPLGAFLMGFVVCLFELPCTGGPYLFILGLLAEKTTMVASIPILLLYNLFFVLPLIIITLLIFFGISDVEKANKWKDENLRTLHLVAGIVMLFLGLLVVLGFI